MEVSDIEVGDMIIYGIVISTCMKRYLENEAACLSKEPSLV